MLIYFSNFVLFAVVQMPKMVIPGKTGGNIQTIQTVKADSSQGTAIPQGATIQQGNLPQGATIVKLLNPGTGKGSSIYYTVKYLGVLQTLKLYCQVVAVQQHICDVI